MSLLTRFLYTTTIVGMNQPLAHDELDYDRYAFNIFTGNGYRLEPDGPPSSIRPPLYPLFLSTIYWIFGRSYTVVRIIQCIIGGLSCILIYYVGSRIFGERNGKISAFIATFYPPFIYFCPLLVTESLFIFLLLLSVFLLLIMREIPALSKVILCGVILGLTVLTRANALFFLPFVLLWIILTFRRGIKKSIVVSAILLCGVAIAIGPWTVRNYLVWHRIVPISLQGGFCFWTSNNPFIADHPTHWGRYALPQQLPFFDELKGLDEAERDRRFWQLGIDFLKNNPDKIPNLLWHKFLRFWNPLPDLSGRDKMVLLLTYGLLLPFMASGLILSFWKEERPLILYFVILAFMLNSLVFWGMGRFRAPIAPYLIMFASLSLNNVFTSGYHFLRPKGS